MAYTPGLTGLSVHGRETATTESVTSGTAKQNTLTNTLQVIARIRHQPADGATSIATLFMGRTAGDMQNLGFDQVQRVTGMAALDVSRLHCLIIPPGWWYQITVATGATIAGVKSIPVN